MEYSYWEYPYWLIVAGAVLLAIGFVGLALRRNEEITPNHQPTEMKASQKPDEQDSSAGTLPPWPWRPPPQAS